MVHNNTFEMIDKMFLEWVRNDLNIHATSFDGWLPVPVVWGKPERAYQAKFDKKMRDEDGALILPIISVTKTGHQSSLTRKGVAVNPIPSSIGPKGSSISIFKEVNQEKTTNFKRKDFFNSTQGLETGKPPFSGKVVYNTYSIDMPVYHVFTYKVRITAQFNQQLNEILQPMTNFDYGHKYFLIRKYNHTLEVFPSDDYVIPEDDITDTERIWEVELSFDVLANTSGMGSNSQKPKNVKTENIVEYKIGREKNYSESELNDLMRTGIKS